MDIKIENLEDAGVLQLLAEHLADMYATTPADSVHALDVEALKHPSIPVNYFKKFRFSIFKN